MKPIITFLLTLTALSSQVSYGVMLCSNEQAYNLGANKTSKTSKCLLASDFAELKSVYYVGQKAAITIDVKDGPDKYDNAVTNLDNYFGSKGIHYIISAAGLAQVPTLGGFFLVDNADDSSVMPTHCLGTPTNGVYVKLSPANEVDCWIFKETYPAQ